MNRQTTKTLSSIVSAATFLVIIFLIGIIYFGAEISKITGINVRNEIVTILIAPVGFIAVLAVGLLSYIVSSREKSHRREDLQKLTRQNSWTYTESMNLPFLKEFNAYLNDSWLEDSNALTGSSNNVLTGILNGRNIIVSDQIYTSGSGKSRKTHEKTLIGIELREAQFPFMCLYPEGFFDKVFDGLTRYDIDFGQFPTFSQKYVLYGKNETHIRSFFNPQILSFYEQQPPFNTACGGKYLVIWGENLLNPAQIMAQLNFLFSLANLFLKK